MAQSPTHDTRFREVFDSTRDAIWSYCYRRLEPDEVPDAVAETFLVAWRRMDKIPDGDDALLWLYAVARNVVRSFRRSTARRTQLHDRLMHLRHTDDQEPDVRVITREEDRALLLSVSRLRPIEQELLRLRTWEELSLAEISEVTGISIRGVESRLARIRKKLEASIKQRESQMWWSPARQKGGER